LTLGKRLSAGYFATMKTVRLRITGRVQGVGYRAWAMRAAADLRLRGWVRNRADGAVELLATGPAEALAAMFEAAHRGPLAAHVDAVEIADDVDDGSVGFLARPTE
jgi:acylphosphatase